MMQISRRIWHLTVLSVHRWTTALQLVVCQQYRSSGSQRLQQLTERLDETAAGYLMEISSDKSKILVNSISQDHLPIYGWIEKLQKKWTCSNTWDAHKLRWNISKESKDKTSASTKEHVGTTRLGVLWKKTNPSVFLQRLHSINHLSCQYCSTDVGDGWWLWIWWGESKPLKANVTGGCLSCHKNGIKRMNICGWQVNTLAGYRKFKLSTIKRHGFAILS